MASNEFRYNDTECPVCMETFKDPKQLPCTHTYCLQCIEKIVGGRKSFSCPECNRDTVVPSRGLQALPDNRYIHAILRITEQAEKLKQEKLQAEKLLEVQGEKVPAKEDLGQQSELICTTHKQPLLLYCDDCQQMICTICGLTKHKIHVIVDMAEKYVEIKEHIKKVIDDAEYINAKYSDYLNKLEEAEKEVKDSTKKNIDEIEKRQEKLIKQIKDATEGQKLEVFQIEEQNIDRIQDLKMRLLGIKKLLSDFLTKNLNDIETASMQELLTSRNDAADTLSTIKLGIFSENVDIGIDKVTYQQSDKPNHLSLDYVGKIERKMIYIHPEWLQNITLQHKWSIGHGINSILYSKDKDYLLASCDDNGVHIIKCFTSLGQEVWQHQTDEDIHGHAIVADDVEYLIVAKEDKIELCNLTDGLVLDTIDISFAAADNGVCAVGDKSFFVVNSSIEPNPLVKFGITNGKLVDMNTVIKTDLCDINGLYKCSVTGDLCVTSYDTIEGIDYTTHDIKWKVTGEFEGSMIDPEGVTGDGGGNIYVADGENNRVLTIRDSLVINVLQLPDCTRAVYDVCCKPSHDYKNPQLFVLSYEDGDDYENRDGDEDEDGADQGAEYNDGDDDGDGEDYENGDGDEDGADQGAEYDDGDDDGDGDEDGDEDNSGIIYVYQINYEIHQ